MTSERREKNELKQEFSRWLSYAQLDAELKTARKYEAR